MKFTDDQKKKLSDGETVWVGNKRYAICRTCNKIGCLDKFIFGSMHLCEKGGE